MSEILPPYCYHDGCFPGMCKKKDPSLCLSVVVELVVKGSKRQQQQIRKAIQRKIVKMLHAHGEKWPFMIDGELTVAWEVKTRINKD